MCKKKRSAEAAIKGYSYQFLQTIAQILEQEDDVMNTIEGIEDLDVYSSDGIDLCQYKYHEFANITNSLIGKPVGIMFNHFLNNPNSKYKYKLIIYTQDEKKFEIKIKEILKTKNAQEQIDKHNKNKIESDSEEFQKQFLLIKAKEFISLENEVIEKIIKMGNLSEEEARYSVLPNFLKTINKLSMEKNEKFRQISCKQLKEKIIFEKHIIDVSFLERIYGEEKAIKEFIRNMKLENISSNSKSHVILLTMDSGRDYTQLIYDVAKKFYYKGNKQDIYPVTFVVDGDDEEISELKKRLLLIMKANNEKLIFNDGYEGYNFSPRIFNMLPISTHTPLNGKVNKVNYNYKIISLKTYKAHESDIKFISPIFFYVDYWDEYITTSYVKSFYMGNFNNEKILLLLGEKNG